jgi:hypothetical protein
VSLAFLFPLSALFGEFLLRYTHHRPLGAATWTLCVLMTYLGLRVIVERARGAKDAGAPAVRILLALGVFLSLGVLGRAWIYGGLD